MDGRDIDEAGNGQDQQHWPLWRSQQEFTASGAGMLPRAHQRRQAAGIEELQASQVDDDDALTCRDDRKRFCGTLGIHDVKLTAQRHDRMTGIFTGTQIRAEHERALLLRQQGVVLTRRLVSLAAFLLLTLRRMSSERTLRLSAPTASRGRGTRQRPPAAAVDEFHARHFGDHRRDKDDEPGNYDHEVTPGH